MLFNEKRFTKQSENLCTSQNKEEQEIFEQFRMDDRQEGFKNCYDKICDINDLSINNLEILKVCGILMKGYINESSNLVSDLFKKYSDLTLTAYLDQVSRILELLKLQGSSYEYFKIVQLIASCLGVLLENDESIGEDLFYHESLILNLSDIFIPLVDNFRLDHKRNMLELVTITHEDGIVNILCIYNILGRHTNQKGDHEMCKILAFDGHYLEQLAKLLKENELAMNKKLWEWCGYSISIIGINCPLISDEHFKDILESVSDEIGDTNEGNEQTYNLIFYIIDNAKSDEVTFKARINYVTTMINIIFDVLIDRLTDITKMEANDLLRKSLYLEIMKTLFISDNLRLYIDKVMHEKSFNLILNLINFDETKEHTILLLSSLLSNGKIEQFKEFGNRDPLRVLITEKFIENNITQVMSSLSLHGKCNFMILLCKMMRRCIEISKDESITDEERDLLFSLFEEQLLKNQIIDIIIMNIDKSTPIKLLHITLAVLEQLFIYERDYRLVGCEKEISAEFQERGGTDCLEMLSTSENDNIYEYYVKLIKLFNY